jgi:hypothetical protein
MEMRKEDRQLVEFFKEGDLINDIAEVYNFLYYKCYGVPDISINKEARKPTNLKWIRRNINTNLKDIENIRYINENTLEIKYINGYTIEFFRIK